MVIRQDYILPTAVTLLLHILVVAAVLASWQMSDSTRFRVQTPRYVTAKLVTLEPSRRPNTKAPSKPAKAKQAPPVVVKTTPPKPIERKSLSKPAAAEQAAPIKKTSNPSTASTKPKVAAPAKPAAKTVASSAGAAASVAASASSAATQDQAQQQRDDLLQALAEEESLMAAEEDVTTAASYAALIKQRVEGGWSRPPSARKNMQVVLSIRMIPTGDVIGVEVVQSSGNAAFDRSAVAAVERAQRFPELSQMQTRVFDAYFRTFTLVFKPEDLLL